DIEPLKRTNPNALFPMFKQMGGTDLGMRVDRAPFTDLRVRQAIFKAIDPETVIKTAFGSGWMSVGLALPTLDWALPEAEISRLYKRDLDGAKRLLREAGMENGFDVTLVTSTNELTLNAAQLIVAQLKEANIRATARPVDYAAYIEQTVARADYDLEWG